MNKLVSFATQYGQVQKNLLKEFVPPYALWMGQGHPLDEQQIRGAFRKGSFFP